MSLFAATVALLVSSLVAGQTLDTQEIFKQTFTQGTNYIQNQEARGIHFATTKNERADFENVRVSLNVLKAEKIPHTTKVLVRGAPQEITIYSQKFTIKADASADFTGTLENGKTVSSHVTVTDAVANLTLSVNFNDVTRFSAVETEFDVSKVITVLVRGAPTNVLTGSIVVTGLPEGTSQDVERYATNQFTQRIHDTVTLAVNYAVNAVNNL